LRRLTCPAAPPREREAAVCLPQNMTAQAMLRRRGVCSVLHFGAARTEEKSDPHAWLSAANIEVTGYPVTNFTEIGYFVSRG
jgi:hypothetical protein